MSDRTVRDKVNILLVDDQPAKLLSYELILKELGETLLIASSAREALEILIKTDVAVLLIDVCMPELDGFELAQMIRDHPRFADTAIIFVSAIHLSDMDSLRGYELGGVDYVSVPVVPEVLRAKVRIFVDLHRKTRQLEALAGDLERRVDERTRELQDAIARQELLAREVDHRARNALAVIQSIVSLTPQGDSASFAESLRGRISAMARAHTILSQSRWHGADLLSLVEEELAPYAAVGGVSIAGDPISILPGVAQSLALALHELATNAAKYGALSRPGGSLQIEWRRRSDSLALDWSETCAFQPAGPGPEGFGSMVVNSSVEFQLGGAVKRIWRPEGLLCRITLPARHFLGADQAAERPRAEPPSQRAADLAGKRVMVVDDELLIAVMTAVILAELGAEVAGPFFAAGPARSAINTRIDAALLDINLGTEFSFDLARDIIAAGVPVIFLTGYQPESLPEEFRSAPLLTKPIDAELLAAAVKRATAPRGAAPDARRTACG